jgi:diacylglycerol kinase (ATP)
VLSALILLASFLLRQWLDVLYILTATVLVLIAELFNSAIEALCDFVEWRESHKIRVIKDIAAAAVGIAILFWAIVLGGAAVHLWGVFSSP